MKIRKNTTISRDILRQAQELMALRSFDDFSEFVSALIREERERRQGPVQFPGAPTTKQKFYPREAPQDVALNDEQPPSPSPAAQHKTNFAAVARRVKKLPRSTPSTGHSPGPKP